MLKPSPLERMMDNMKNPKPINFRMVNGWAQLKVVGFKFKDSRPYLFLDIGNHSSPDPLKYGYMEDRDLRRLKAWVDDCLKYHGRASK